MSDQKQVIRVIYHQQHGYFSGLGGILLMFRFIVWISALLWHKYTKKLLQKYLQKLFSKISTCWLFFHNALVTGKRWRIEYDLTLYNVRSCLLKFLCFAFRQQHMYFCKCQNMWRVYSDRATVCVVQRSCKLFCLLSLIVFSWLWDMIWVLPECVFGKSLLAS